MSNWSKSAFYGGVYTKTQKTENCISCDIKYSCKYRKLTARLEQFRNFSGIGWGKTKYLSKIYNRKLRNHIWKKQEVYLPVLIAIALLALVFVSKTAFSKTVSFFHLTNPLSLHELEHAPPLFNRFPLLLHHLEERGACLLAELQAC